MTISHIRKSFHMEGGGDVIALADLDLRVKEGEFVSIVGASGCGKSTLLRIIAGLEKSDEGEISIDGRVVVEPGRECGLIFQEPRLFPWMRVEDNIAFGMSEGRKRNFGRKGVSERVDEVLELVGLREFKRAYPYQLSGGMQQRISIARSLVEKPKVLLLDEPLGALDALTRIQMQNEIQRIQEEEHITMILVTHDIDEAIYLGNRVVVLSSRPGSVRMNISVGLKKPRDRSSIGFIKLRESIYQEFFDGRKGES